jgi:hypothetical protein
MLSDAIFSDDVPDLRTDIDEAGGVVHHGDEWRGAQGHERREVVERDAA